MKNTRLVVFDKSSGRSKIMMQQQLEILRESITHLQAALQQHYLEIGELRRSIEQSSRSFDLKPKEILEKFEQISMFYGKGVEFKRYPKRYVLRQVEGNI